MLAPSQLRGRPVLVTGWGITGQALVGPLVELGARVTVSDRNPEAREQAAAIVDAVAAPEDLIATVDSFELVVTSPGFRPQEPLLAAAAAAGKPIWGDVEFAWWLDQNEIYGPPRTWLVVTGTNGKTTTTSMLAAILSAAGIANAACGNIGLPVTTALALTGPRADVLAMELSSFQLFWAPSVRPHAGVVLNIAEDHLDWHGGIAEYIAAKVRALSGSVAIIGLDDPHAGELIAQARAPRTVGFRLGQPRLGELGVSNGQLVDWAFSDEPLALAAAHDVRPPGPAGVLDALAASSLARSIGVNEQVIEDALATFTVGSHRAELIGVIDGVRYVDDSKATNPHAARTSLLACDRAVWLAGGQLKGAAVDDLVIEVASRLRAAVLFGVDAELIAHALARHAPDIPVHRVLSGDDTAVTGETIVTNDSSPEAVMQSAVVVAAQLAQPGDTVLLAPAAASLDMFRSYAHRGTSFVDAVRELGGEETSGDRNH